MVGLDEERVEETQGATGMSPLQREKGPRRLGAERGRSAVAVGLGAAVPIPPAVRLGAEGSAQGAVGAVPLTAQR